MPRTTEPLLATPQSDEDAARVEESQTPHGSWEDYSEYVQTVSELPEKQAQAYALRQFGYSRTDAAGCLGISPNTFDGHVQALQRKQHSTGWANLLLSLFGSNLALELVGGRVDSGTPSDRSYESYVFVNVAEPVHADTPIYAVVWRLVEAGQAASTSHEAFATFDSQSAVIDGAYGLAAFDSLREQVTRLEALKAAGFNAKELDTQHRERKAETASAYDTLLAGETTVEAVADRFGVPESLIATHVQWHQYATVEAIQ